MHVREKLVKTIYLSSFNERAGKTLIAIGLLQKFKKEGYNVKYFKPVGKPIGALTNKADRDVSFIFMNIIESEHDIDTICPVSITPNYYIDNIDIEQRTEYTEKIKKAYEKIKQDCDMVIIEGTPNFRYYCRVGLDDVTIAKELGIDGIYFILDNSTDNFVDTLLFTKKYLDFREMKINGLIMNQIDFDYVERVKELQKKHIEKYNIPLVGIIQKDPLLSEPTVLEIMEGIGAELINNPPDESMNKNVKSILIGAMDVSSAMKYVRQSVSAACITGGDRSELILATLESNVSVIILTGYIQPDISVKVKADELGIPLLLSPSDTYTTLYNIERIKPGIQPEEKQIALEIIEKYINWELLKP